MGVIQSIPYEHSPVHGCLNFGVFFDGGISYNGTTALATITFDSGGTAASGTKITFCGQTFELDGFGVNDGYYFNWTGLSDVDRAAAFVETLYANLFFSPDRVTINHFGNSVTVTFNKVGLQSNWGFSDGGISQISFYDVNGSGITTLSNAKFIHAIYKDRSSLSLPDIRLTEDKETPNNITLDYSTIPPSSIFTPKILDYSSDLSPLLATHIPQIYYPNYVMTLDDTFSMPIYLRAGYSYKDNCETRTIFFGKSDTITIYNSLFQKNKILSDEELMNPYVFGNKLMLIKNRYRICRNTNFAVWTASLEGYQSIDVVYYSASGSVLESNTNELDESTGVRYTNVGTFGSAAPADAAYYIVNYLDNNGDVWAVRFDLIDCKCVAGEFIFLSDLGAYETILADKQVKQQNDTTNELSSNKNGCDVLSLQKGGRSIINKTSEETYTYEFYVDTTTDDELEFINQFIRSQSVFMKMFVKEADAFFYIKLIPESTNFVSLEEGKRPTLTFTFKLNQQYQIHPQNEAAFI